MVVAEDFKTIGQVAEQLNLSSHVLRFWESKFRQLRPIKRRNGRRYYSQADIELIENIRILLHVKGFTIKGAQQELASKNQVFLMQNLVTKTQKMPDLTVKKKHLEDILLKLKNAEDELRK